MQVRPVLMVSALKRYRPEVYDEIKQLVTSGNALSDFNQIRSIVGDFCDLRNITADELKHAKWNRHITRERELLIGVIFKFYQPHLIKGIDHGKVAKGLMKAITECLGCNYGTTRFSVSNSLSAYDFYPAFRKEVDSIYETLKCNYDG